MEIGEEEPIEYLAIPQEVIDDMEGKINIPDIEVVKEEGFDGIKKDYVKVQWADPFGAVTKRYDVNDHIMIIGCDLSACKISKLKSSKSSKSSKSKSGSCKCEEKEVYAVLHPFDEWRSHHIVEIS